jgi:glycosyltransferase involved in cell wall biosynthesis
MDYGGDNRMTEIEAYKCEPETEQRSPLISVVIPTRFRPVIVQRAIASVLNQTFSNFEIVVVVDGPDQDTQNALGLISDFRVRVIALPENVGGSEARNVGVRNARGMWIALLDDDDEWLPEKLALQLETAIASKVPFPLVVTQIIVCEIHRHSVWPRRFPRDGEPLSDYIFCRRRFAPGDGYLQTSSFFCSRELFVNIPFQKGLKKFQDTDWLFRAARHPEVRIVGIPRPLVIYHLDEEMARVSNAAQWEYMLDWAIKNRSYFTRRSLSFFVATACVPLASQARGGLRGLLKLGFEFVFHGRPTWNATVMFIVFALISSRLRQRVTELILVLKRLTGEPKQRYVSEETATPE